MRLTFTGFFREGGKLETVLAKGEIVEGGAMLSGSVAGAILAQATNLGVPYVVRALVLGSRSPSRSRMMRDIGFRPAMAKHPVDEATTLLRSSFDQGLANRPVRWIMLAERVHRWRDHLCVLRDAAVPAAVVRRPAGLSGSPDSRPRSWPAHRWRAVCSSVTCDDVFRRRTSVLLAALSLSTVDARRRSGSCPILRHVVLLVLWGLVFAAVTPVRQAYREWAHRVEASGHGFVVRFAAWARAGLVSQPILGQTADQWGYPASYACSAFIQAVAIPFVLLARRQRADSDRFEAG